MIAFPYLYSIMMSFDLFWQEGYQDPDSQPMAIPHGFRMGDSGSMGFAWVRVNPFKSHLGPIRASPLLIHGEVIHGSVILTLYGPMDDPCKTHMGFTWVSDGREALFYFC